MSKISMKNLFISLYFSSTEKEVDEVIQKNLDIFEDNNWFPLGNIPNNFGVIENQQSNPIAALIEKLTNSIDAILMKKCLEAGIDPKSAEAPHSIEEAVKVFYSKEYENWNLSSFRKKQAENLQIIADGPKMETSLIIYDDGEGQHPENFEKTFLSLLTGNKNDIHFVQGKYNMGGSGAIVFCGQKRYQLVGSRRFDNSGDFGFTLIREHPLSHDEKKSLKNTWYEYLKIEGKIPSFEIDELNLNLHNRKFKTGTVIKLYSYDLPSGSRSVISRDLNQSINEYLFNPALPILTVDNDTRYPKDINLVRDLYGLKCRLEQSNNKYIEKDDSFSETFSNELFGKAKVSCYVFKNRVENKSLQETKDTIKREFFKNNMYVLFSINGQVHGYYSSEFTSRTLQLNFLKNHLLIHVDCTEMEYSFRKELFMASRDRLKDSKETRELRKFLGKKLGAKNGPLAEIEKKRREFPSVDTGNTKELLKSFTKSLPMNSELMKLLGQTFKLEQKKEKPGKKETKQKAQKDTSEPFKPQRFPSYFKLKAKNDGEKEVAKIPLNGEKIIRFESDVENQYFDRMEEPGTLKIALLNFKQNETSGGNAPGEIESIEDVFNVNISSPKDGTIKVSLNPKKEVQVGDTVQVKVTLESPGVDYDEIFWVKISDPEEKKEPTKKKEEVEDDIQGLPDFFLAYKEAPENMYSWLQVEDATNQEMDYKTVICPYVKGENLECIYINMDSNVLKSFKSKYKNINEKQMKLAEDKYISSVYFHTLFLYTITKNKKYKIVQEENGRDNDIDIEKYIKDLFESYYSEFILNFGGTNELMFGMGD